MIQDIDFVVPYVNNTDILWRKIYNEYCETHNLKSKLLDLNTERYNDNLVLIDYLLKLVNKNMPWVRNIYLLLMNREQAPKDLPSNVKIVYHGAFIPQKYLPTFNSTTIEMFLWNIKDLGEYFIYANDDMLPLKPLQPSDFFAEDGKIKIEWWNEDIRECGTMFRQQCMNSHHHILYRLHKPCDKFIYYRPAHSFTPMVKSHCKYAYDLLQDMIEKHIRAFRTEYQYNQYIYPIFERAVFGTCDSTIDFSYTQCSDDEIDLDHDIVCLNIIPTKKVNELRERLDKLL